MLNLRGHLQERVPLSSKVTLGSRVSLFLCITQFAFHAREGALGVRSPYLEDRKTLHTVGTSFVYTSPCRTKR